MSVSLVKVPRWLTDEALTATTKGSNLGAARAAGYLLDVPAHERLTRESAGVLFANTSPGWRMADGVGHACRATLAWCESLLNRERERKLAEAALRRAGVTGVVFWDGSVGIANPDSLLIEQVIR